MKLYNFEQGGCVFLRFTPNFNYSSSDTFHRFLMHRWFFSVRPKFNNVLLFFHTPYNFCSNQIFILVNAFPALVLNIKGSNHRINYLDPFISHTRFNVFTFQ